MVVRRRDLEGGLADGTRPQQQPVEDEGEHRKLQKDGDGVGREVQGERPEADDRGVGEAGDVDGVGEASHLDGEGVGEVPQQRHEVAPAAEQCPADGRKQSHDDEEGRRRDEGARHPDGDAAADQPLAERVEHVRHGDGEEDDLEDVPEHRRRQEADGGE